MWCRWPFPGGWRSAPGGIGDHVFLDATGIAREVFARRFPTVSAACALAGVDPSTDPIPVAPAAHYHCGGVLTDLDGRTTVPGLYAIGEVARTGSARREPAGVELAAGGAGDG